MECRASQASPVVRDHRHGHHSFRNMSSTMKVPLGATGTGIASHRPSDGSATTVDQESSQAQGRDRKTGYSLLESAVLMTCKVAEGTGRSVQTLHSPLHAQPREQAVLGACPWRKHPWLSMDTSHICMFSLCFLPLSVRCPVVVTGTWVRGTGRVPRLDGSRHCIRDRCSSHYVRQIWLGAGALQGAPGARLTDTDGDLGPGDA